MPHRAWPGDACVAQHLTFRGLSQLRLLPAMLHVARLSARTHGLATPAGISILFRISKMCLRGRLCILRHGQMHRKHTGPANIQFAPRCLSKPTCRSRLPDTSTKTQLPPLCCSLTARVRMPTLSALESVAVTPRLVAGGPACATGSAQVDVVLRLQIL